MKQELCENMVKVSRLSGRYVGFLRRLKYALQCGGCFVE